MTTETDNRDLKEMEKYYLARIEVLERELKRLLDATAFLIPGKN